MPNNPQYPPPPPAIPNFNPASAAGARITLDRYDFEAHLDGINPPNGVYVHSFRHSADQVDVVPPLVIGGNTCNNVKSALDAFTAIFNPALPQKATPSIYGVISLGSYGGDLGQGSGPGIASVIGIQGRPISPLPPTPNQVLAWNGSQWYPTSTGTFTASGDLTGSSASQNVISLTGDITTNVGYHTINSSADYIQFGSGTHPYIKQSISTGSSGSTMVMTAQGVSSGTGGQLILGGGSSALGSGNLLGGVMLSIGGNPLVDANAAATLQVTQVNATSAQTVAAFFPPPTGLTTTQMPPNTGSGVIYIGNTAVAPTAPSPSGAILWSDTTGTLNVMQSNGNSFSIGSIPNPSIWGTQSVASGESITYRDFAASTTSAVNVFATHVYTIPNNTCARVDCVIIGKQVGSTNCVQYNLSLGYVVDGTGNTTQMGTLTNSDPRSYGSAVWNAPTISNSGSSLQVFTGYTTSGTVNWTVVTQIILSAQG